MERFLENTDRGIDDTRKVTPNRLLFALEAQAKLTTKEILVHGDEHLGEIPKGKKVIIATTHISDIDIPIAASVLASKLDLAITNMSVHSSFFQEPGVKLAMKMVGTDNFIPIDYHKQNGEKHGTFNPDNFEPMKEALNKGKAVVVAAHNPSHNWAMSGGGYGAAYLAEISGPDTVVLPVAVNLESETSVGMYEDQLKTLIKKPVANVFIGQPIELSVVSGIDLFSRVLRQRANGESISSEDLAGFSQVKSELQGQSDRIMRSLAANLPEEKRGRYIEEIESAT